MRPQHRQILTVETRPLPADRHIGGIIYVLDERAFVSGYRDGAGLPQWAPVGVGAQSRQYPYAWSNSTQLGDPGTGRVRALTGDPLVATTLAVSLYDADGSVHTALAQLRLGDQIVLYVAGDLSRYAAYTLSATPINHGNLWLELGVTLSDQGSAGFAPSNNAALDFALRTSG